MKSRILFGAGITAGIFVFCVYIVTIALSIDILNNVLKIAGGLVSVSTQGYKSVLAVDRDGKRPDADGPGCVGEYTDADQEAPVSALDEVITGYGLSQGFGEDFSTSPEHRIYLVYDMLQSARSEKGFWQELTERQGEKRAEGANPAWGDGLTGAKPVKNCVNVLFLGIDRSDERDEWLKIYRSDVITLACIDLDTNKVDILGIPRDTLTYVPVEGKKDKINHAYAFGSLVDKGAQSVIDAVDNFIKYSSVDYYFSIDMEPIPEIVDILGGVELDVDIEFYSRGSLIQKGLQTLDGEQALDYIRNRKAAGGDIGRIKRQHKFMRAMYAKLRESGQLFNAIKIMLGYSKHVQTDMNLQRLASFTVLAADIREEDASFHIVPGSSKYINKVSYWVPDEKLTDSLLRQIFYKE